MVFWRTDNHKYNILIKIGGGNITQTRTFIEDTAKKFDPEGTFEVHFLDDSLENLYNQEERLARFIEFVSLWTILLALTGLLGLIIFISRDRIKEIGIRKVNGGIHIGNRTDAQPKRGCLAGNSLYYRHTHSLFGHGPLARELCLQNRP